MVRTDAEDGVEMLRAPMPRVAAGSREGRY